MSDAFLIQNPYHQYAITFCQLLAERGLRPIFFFTDPKERYYEARHLPAFAELRPLASYEVEPSDLTGFARRIKKRFGRVAGVIPYAEPTLESTIELVRELEIPWNDPQVLSRFRDKAALKDEVTRVRPDLRVGRYIRVRSARDLPEILPRPFIVKPNDGFGSRGVSVFAAGTRRAEIDAHLHARPGVTFLAEEYLTGTLYAVDGYVDVGSEVQVVSIFTSGRLRANGSEVAYGDGDLVHRDDRHFAALERYAQEVVKATGLVRSPFHMEVMVDGEGPCLIEVGARLIGHGHARTCGLPHGEGFDFFRVAASGYVGEAAQGDLGLDPARYERTEVRKVYGLAHTRETIYELAGVSEIEALPAFRYWTSRPEVGAAIVPTVDLFTVPFSLVLSGSRGSVLADEAGRVRELLRWNRRVSPGRRLRVEGRRLGQRILRKAGWLLKRALG